MTPSGCKVSASRREQGPMKKYSWFDAVAFLLISLMSVAAGIATDSGRVDTGHALEVSASQQ